MTSLDLIVLVFLGYHAFLGVRKGLITLIFDVGALIGGVWVALLYYQVAGLYLQHTLGMKPPYTTMLSFLSIWGVCYGVLMGIGRLINRISNLGVLAPFNRLGGACLGALKGLLYSVPILILISYTTLDFYHESKIAKPINTMLQDHVLSQERIKELLERWGVSSKQKQVKKIKEDPGLQAIQRVFEGDFSEDFDALLQEI